MQGFKILLGSVFRRGQVDVRYKNVDEHYSSQALNFIEEVWSRKRSGATRLYDGKLFRFAGFETAGENLILEFRNTSFKRFVGSREGEFTRRFKSSGANPVSVGALVSTSDQRFIVGKRRDDLYANPGKYSVIAGVMEREKDFKGGKPDPFEAILRELEEEKGIQKAEVKDLLCL